MSSAITTALQQRYANASDSSLADEIEAAYKQHIALGLADNNIEQRICSKSDYVYWQQLSEILLAQELIKVGLTPLHQNEGPDFLLDSNGQRIWIEVICPEPHGIPAEWLNPLTNGSWTFPHVEMLLRWTAAIKTKALKQRTYIENGIIGADDAYVIAVNGRLLRGPAFPQIEGISQFPFAVEAAFRVGPWEIRIDRNTMQSTGAGHQDRPYIPKPNGAQVPTDTFLDPEFSSISAIWAVDVDENLLLGRSRPMTLVHNPNTPNPIAQNILPAHSEYVAVDEGDHYALTHHAGLLSNEAAGERTNSATPYQYRTFPTLKILWGLIKREFLRIRVKLK